MRTSAIAALAAAAALGGRASAQNAPEAILRPDGVVGTIRGTNIVDAIDYTPLGEPGTLVLPTQLVYKAEFKKPPVRKPGMVLIYQKILFVEQQFSTGVAILGEQPGIVVGTHGGSACVSSSSCRSQSSARFPQPPLSPHASQHRGAFP